MQSIPTCANAEKLFVIGTLDPSTINENMGGVVKKQCKTCGKPIFIGMKLYDIIKNPKSDDLIQMTCKPCSVLPQGV